MWGELAIKPPSQFSRCVPVNRDLTSGASVRPETISRTQRATKVKTCVGISLKLLHCRDTPLPAL